MKTLTLTLLLVLLLPPTVAEERIPILDEEQKRDILYNNAARFLRLSEDEIARPHGEQTDD